MRALEMMSVVIDYCDLLAEKQREAAAGMAGILEKGKSLTPAQHQYLQSMYDSVVAAKFGLEPMSTDREFAARRAIAKARGSRRGK